MALDKLVDSTLLDDSLLNTASAIRKKTGGSSSIDYDYGTETNQGFADAIEDIRTPVDNTITTLTASDVTVSGKTVTIPVDKYTGTVGATAIIKSVADGSATTPDTTVTANPSISVNASGLITATASATEDVTPTVSAGYVSSGTAGTITVSGSNTSQLSTQGAKTVTPTESEQTAVASGKYTTGTVKVGAIPSDYVGSEVPQNDSEDLVVSGRTVTAPSGYYAESASASVASGSVTQNAPTINSSTGLVTATSTVSEGYVDDDTKSNTLQLSTQGATTITPGTTSKTAVASGKYTTGTVSVAGDADLVAVNIKKGVDIFGVTGTFTSDANATAAQIRSGKTAYVDGSKVTGSMADTVVTEGTTTSSGGTITRGEWSQTAGYTAARTISPSTFANEATSGKTYVDISDDAPALVEGDYLYVNKGYNDDIKISLAKLVPDGTDVKGHGEYILVGHSARDDDGTLVAGTITTLVAGDVSVDGRTITIPTQKYTGANGSTAITKSIGVGTVTSGTANITSLTKTYNSTSGKFDITGSADVSAPSVGTAGYISSSEGTRSKKTGGATVSTTIDKIVASASISTTKKKPSITKQSISISGVTDAASGSATTTAPSSGVYVAVKSAENASTITPSISVTTAGYGDATNHGITATGASVGAAASDMTYVPITTTSASVSGKTVTYGTGWITGGSQSVADGAYDASVSAHSITTAPVVTGALSGKGSTIGTTTKPSGTDGTDYWAFTPGVSLTTTGKSTAKGKAIISTSGYIVEGNKETDASVIDITPTRNNGTTRYLTKATTSSTNGTATVTAGTASTSVTGMVTTTTNTGYSVSASATGGSASVTASSVTVGAGYNPSSVTASTTADSATGDSASQTKYIQKGALSASVSSNSGGSASMAATGFTPLASGTSSYYVTLSTSAGSVKAKATVGTEGYVKSETAETSATTVSVSGNGNKLYIPAGEYAGSVSSHTISTAPVVTGALSGKITTIGTTTKPSGTDGTDYWSVTPGVSLTTTGKSSAKGKATISSAGYISTGNNESAEDVIDITPTRNNGTTRYLAKATSTTSNGTASATAGTASTSVTGMVTTTTNTGYSVSASATGGNASVTASSVTLGVGYNPSSVTASTTASSETGNNASQTKYIQKGALSASVSSNSSGSASMAATGFTASSNATSYYVTLSTSAGSVKAKASVGTEGYVKTETNETSATSVSVSGNGNKLYVPAGAYSASVASQGTNTAAAFTPTATGTITDITTTTAPSSGTDGTDYWTLTPDGNVTTGKARAKATATIGTAGYIPTGSSTTSSYTTWDITTTKNAGTARYLSKATSSVTNGTASATANAGTASIAKQPSASASATANGMDGGYYTDTTTSSYYVDCSASAASGYSTATGGSASASVTASSATVGVGYNPSSVTASTSASSTGNKTGNTATSTEVTASESKKIYLKAASISWSGGGLSNTTNYTGTPTVSLALDSQTTSGIAITDTAQSSGYYVKLTGSTAKLTGTTKVTRADYKETRTAGYLPARSATTILSSTTSSPSVTVNAATKTRYLTLPTATFASTATSGTTYTDVSDSGPTLVAGDYLYINKGWTPDCKISLAKLVPDGSDVKGHAEYILSGHSAYDNDGTLVSGSIATLTASNVTVSGKTVTIPVGYYTGASGATAVTKSVADGTITNNTTLPSGKTSSGTINRGSYIKIGAGYYTERYYLAQNVNNGTITNNTTLPSGSSSTGTINRGSYIKIGAGYYSADKYYLAQANSGTLTITASGDTSCDGYANVSVATGSITNNTSGGTSTATINRGKQIKIGAGYYASDLYYTAQSNSGTKTITASGTTSCDGYANVSVAAGTVSVSQSLPSGASSSGTCTRGKYVKVSAGYYASDTYYLAQNVSNGTITNNTTLPSGSTSVGTINRGSYIKIGAGYYSADAYYLAQNVSNGTITNNTTLPSGSTSTNITVGKYIKIGAGYYASDAYYYASYPSNGTISVNQSLPSGSSSSGTCNRGTYIKIGAGYYSADKYYLAQNVSNGTITNNTSGGTSAGTINFGKQIKIGAGYYSADAYYTAQAPSGNIELTQATSTDVSAKATATVRGVTAAISGGGLSGTATASSSTATLSDSTNTSGISFTTACTATRAKVSCTASTAGWASGTIKELAQGTGAMTAKTYYINAVSLPKSKSFSITVYTGASTQTTFVFTTDADGNTVVTG